MNKPGFLLVFLLGMFSTSASLAAKEGYYRWQDEQGTLHFTQKPPIGKNYEFIRGNSASYVGSRPANQEKQAESQDQAQSPSQEATQLQFAPPKDPERCAQAQRNLKSLNSPGVRIRSTDANGQSRFLNKEEIELERNRAKDAAAVFCD